MLRRVIGVSWGRASSPVSVEIRPVGVSAPDRAGCQRRWAEVTRLRRAARWDASERSAVGSPRPHGADGGVATLLTHPINNRHYVRVETGLSFIRVADELTAGAWLLIHNEIIASAPLTLEEVVSRSKLNALDLASLDGVVVGCSTVRPAADHDPVTVIVRILPAFRRRGLGSDFLVHALAHAREVGALDVQTIVLASNSDGLEFALRRGFVETERYTLDGDTVPFIHLATSLEPVANG
jgi:GNAT superfamily N-acetyltransferase